MFAYLGTFSGSSQNVQMSLNNHVEMDPGSRIQCQCPYQFLEGHIIWIHLVHFWNLVFFLYDCWDVPDLNHRFCWNLPATTNSRKMFRFSDEGLISTSIVYELLVVGGQAHVLIQFGTIHDIWFPINISFSIFQGMFVVSCRSTAHNSLH